jgi:hypothetical protein
VQASPPGTLITGPVTGQGSDGTYTVSISQTVASELMASLFIDTVTCVYYAVPTPLENNSDTNSITTACPDLLTYAALCYAGDFFTDKRLPNWENRYQAIKTDIQQMADSDELSGGATVAPAYIYPDDMEPNLILVT